MRTALFPGSFDPFTLGHAAIVEDGLRIFDRIIVGIGRNNDKHGLLTLDKREALINRLYAEEPRVSVQIYEGLTGEFCRQAGADFILRGMRNTVDYEYERNMMLINQRLFPEITTVLLFTPPQYVAISSSMIRELVQYGGDLTGLMPHNVDLKDFLE